MLGKEKERTAAALCAKHICMSESSSLALWRAAPCSLVSNQYSGAGMALHKLYYTAHDDDEKGLFTAMCK